MSNFKMNNLQGWMICLVWNSLLWIPSSYGASSATLTCAQYRPAVIRSYWDVNAMCTSCSTAENCGYCESTMECQEGDSTGPEVGIMCPDWNFGTKPCPAPPSCSTITDCNECSANHKCAYCGSQRRCLSIEESFVAQCKGLVFDGECPIAYVGPKIIQGSVLVTYDKVFGGGNFTVEGTSEL